MAEPRERTPGVWEVVVSWTEDGKNRRISRTVRGGKRKALDLRRQLETEVAHGKHRARREGDRCETVNDVLDVWVAARSPEWSPKNAKETPARLALHIRPALGSFPVRQLTTEKIERHIATLTGHHTQRLCFAHLRAAFREASRLGLIDNSPMDRARPPRQPPRTIKAMTPVDAVIAVEEAARRDGPPWMPSLLRVAVVSGMRRGELAALGWGDIDLDAAAITVRRALSVGQVAPPKSRAERQVSIDLGTVEVLRSWRIRNVEEMLANGDRLTPSTRVWRGVSPDMITRRWTKLARSVGVDARWKDATRSLSASVLAEAGVPLHVAQDRLGHAELATTMTHYVRAAAGADAAAADTIAGAVFGV